MGSALIFSFIMELVSYVFLNKKKKKKNPNVMKPP